MRLLKPALLYFLIVFGVGFILGPIRVLWLVPRVGERTAELLELPLMLVAIILAAGWINRRFAELDSPISKLSVGMIAFVMVLSAEFIVGMTLRGLSLTQIILDRDPVSGTAYYSSLLLLALMPWLLSRIQRKAQKVC